MKNRKIKCIQGERNSSVLTQVRVKDTNFQFVMPIICGIRSLVNSAVQFIFFLVSLFFFFKLLFPVLFTINSWYTLTSSVQSASTWWHRIFQLCMLSSTYIWCFLISWNLRTYGRYIPISLHSLTSTCLLWLKLKGLLEDTWVLF